MIKQNWQAWSLPAKILWGVGIAMNAAVLLLLFFVHIEGPLFSIIMVTCMTVSLVLLFCIMLLKDKQRAPQEHTLLEK